MKSSGLAGLLLCVIVFVALGLWIINANAEDTAKAGFRSVEPFPGAPYPSDRFSDSPYMYVPDEFAQLPPELPPAKRKGVYLEDPTQTVAYNVLTGEVTTESGGASLLEGIAPSLPGPAPSWEVPPADETDGRVKITSTSSYPWRTHTKVFMEWPDNPGKYGGCSGAIVDGFHVLTAGHCVHSQDHGGWALSVIVVPGYNCGYKPYYEAYSTYLRSYNGWTEDENPEHDWALVTLDRNIGNQTGWMGRYTTTDLDWYEDHVFNGAGYPSDLEEAKCLYWDVGLGEEAWEYYLAVDIEVATGQSGMPIWENQSGPEYIVAVFAYLTCGGGYGSCSTRLNEDKFDRLIYWLTLDTPPLDKPDLIDSGPIGSGFSPQTVIPGVTSFTAFMVVQNIGTAQAPAPFNVSYYISTDDVITPSDTFIGTDLIIYAVDPFDYEDSLWTGTFPTGVPAGTYHVGWIADSGGVLDEFNENNNATADTEMMLTVQRPDHIVSGRVYHPPDQGIAGIKMTGLPGTPVTNSNGEYSAVVPHEWAGTVTPVGCYNFTPNKKTYSMVLWNLSNQNFTAFVKDCSYLTDDCKTGYCDPEDGACKYDPKPNGTPCDDQKWCTVEDECLHGSCMGDPRDCGDGVDCTGDVCVGLLQTCLHVALDGYCDDGDPCNGAEWCSMASGCQPGAPLDCNDYNECTYDWCNPGIGCQYAPLNGQPCDDGLFCTVDETCIDGVCLNGLPRDCADQIDCTADVCNENAGVCEHNPSSDFCDNGIFCDGEEFCDEANGCQPGTPPDCSDDGVFCNGTEFCDEDAEMCSHTGGPCRTGLGQQCGTGTQACDEAADQCVPSSDECPDDGLYCNGTELCSPAAGICVSTGDPCSDDELYCNGEEYCDEAGAQCAHTGTPCPDDGIFCNGVESCQEQTHLCEHSGDPCSPDPACCDEDGQACVPIQVAIHHPQSGQEHPAGTDVLVHWTSEQSWCLDTYEASVLYHLGDSVFEETIGAGDPVNILYWEAPVLDWDEVEIVVGAYHDDRGVQESSGLFALRAPGSPSIVHAATDAGETVITWEGFESDILVLDGPYDPSFAGSTMVRFVTSPWMDSDAGNASERYYRILNAGTSAASPVTLGKRDIEVWQGYNLLAVPLLYDDELWASEIVADMASQGGSVLEVSKWNSASGTWVTHDPSWPLEDFTSQPGDGFFLKAGNDFTWTVSGEVPRNEPISIDTVYGYAMFGVPTWEFDMASDVAGAMIAQGCDPLEISRWLASAGIWQTYDLSWPLEDFAVDAADGYFVKAGADAPFTLNPMSVQAEAISATEAQVTFNTDVAGVAFIKVGADPGILDTLAFDDRDALYEGTDHVFTLTGLTPGQTVYFEILFLGETFGDDGEPYSFEM